MATEPLLSESRSTEQEPQYRSTHRRTIRINDNQTNDDESEEAPKKRCTWKHSLAILIIVVVTRLLLDAFLSALYAVFCRTSLRNIFIIMGIKTQLKLSLLFSKMENIFDL